MANTKAQPANTPSNVDNYGDDDFKHVVLDADGAASFESEDEARRWADAKGHEITENKDGNESNLVRVGTAWAILDAHRAGSTKSANTVESGSSDAAHGDEFRTSGDPLVRAHGAAIEGGDSLQNASMNRPDPTPQYTPPPVPASSEFHDTTPPSDDV
jgi:hypothetical protein